MWSSISKRVNTRSMTKTCGQRTDDFEAFIDLNGDNHEYYEFEMNALNTGRDLFLPRPYKDAARPTTAGKSPG